MRSSYSCSLSLLPFVRAESIAARRASQFCLGLKTWWGRGGGGGKKEVAYTNVFTAGRGSRHLSNIVVNYIIIDNIDFAEKLSFEVAFVGVCRSDLNATNIDSSQI